MNITKAGLEWIAEFECGGKAYYEKRLSRPTWPGGASGVTIGIGYDLGYNTLEQISDDWGFLGEDTVKALQSVRGLKGTKAKGRTALPGPVRISWEDALRVFQEETVPRFSKLTVGAFPGAELLPSGAQEAMLSLVFNRGSDLSGDRRREMAKIAELISYYEGSSNRPRLLGLIADQFMSMRRLWVGKGLDGLLIRRASEANRIRTAQ